MERPRYVRRARDFYNTDRPNTAPRGYPHVDVAPRVRPQADCNSIDVHSWQRDYILSQSATEVSAPPPMSISAGNDSAPTSQQTAYEIVSLYFDSLSADTDSDRQNGELKFTIATINNNKPLQNVVAVRLSPFWFPRLVNPATQPDYYFFNRVYGFIATTPTDQAVKAPSGNRYNYEFITQNLNSIAVELTPVHDEYVFSNPVISLDTFRMVFTTPIGFKRVPLPVDTVAAVSVANSNPAQFTLLDTSALGPVGVPTAPGVAVYINGFNSSSSTINSQVNSSGGQYVTNINSTTTITVGALDLTGIPATICSIVIAKNRIAFEARFTIKGTTSTNGLTAVYSL